MFAIGSLVCYFLLWRLCHAGTGLSYSETHSDYLTNDTHTAKDSNVFMRRFLEEYPDFAKHDFYIIGESHLRATVMHASARICHNHKFCTTSRHSVCCVCSCMCLLSRAGKMQDLSHTRHNCASVPCMRALQMLQACVTNTGTVSLAEIYPC